MNLVADIACPKVVENSTIVKPTNTPIQESSGLSTGSLLCIIFFVLLTIYFLGGACALRMTRGAQGTELIPNLEFWSQLPGLVRVIIFFSFYKD